MSGDKKNSTDEKFKNAVKNADKGTRKGDKRVKRTGKKWPVAIFCVGLVALIAGITMLVVRLVAQPAVADAEFLISSREWTREDEPLVIWNFTEVGKGTLTTDGGKTNYDFIWALDNGKLEIETDWLYEIDDEFEYTLDQGAKTLTLKSGDKEVVFRVGEE